MLLWYKIEFGRRYEVFQLDVAENDALTGTISTI